jgi:hypothetical protein
MAFVVIIAVNLAIGRALLEYDGFILAGIAPSALALQFALVRLIRGRRLSRAFWSGFIAGLLVVATLFLWGMYQGRLSRSRFDPELGQTIVRWRPGTPLWPGWPAYRSYAYQIILRLPHGPDILNSYDATSLSIVAVVFFLPQLLAATAGGLLALFIAWVFQMAIRLSRRATSPAAEPNRGSGRL